MRQTELQDLTQELQSLQAKARPVEKELSQGSVKLFKAQEKEKTYDLEEAQKSLREQIGDVDLLEQFQTTQVQVSKLRE